MKTPYAILIGLALIAAALFFREPSVAPANAGIMSDVHGLDCYRRTFDKGRSDESRITECVILHGDQISLMELDGRLWEGPFRNKWR